MTSRKTDPAASLAVPSESAVPPGRERARRAVLEAAARLLAGDPEASIDDIAHASGVARATLYRWFAGRDQLIEAIFEQILDEAREITRTALGERAIPPLAVIQSICRECLALGERYRFMEAKLEHEDQSDQLREELVSFIAAAQGRGEMRDELTPEWVASMLEGTILAACKDVHAGRQSRLRSADLMDRTLRRLLDPAREGD